MPSRRKTYLIIGAGVVVLGVALGMTACIVSAIGGASSYRPQELKTGLSDEATALVAAAHDGIDATRLLDHHVHMLGLGSGGSGTWVNPEMRSWLSPMRRLRFSVYKDASGIENEENADAEYLGRLLELIRHIEKPGRYQILAFDHAYHRDGTKNLHQSELYTPNAHVFGLAKRHPDLLVPVMSVNPYRNDALAELETWAQRGGRMVKWLPNAMGIDASDPKLDVYYGKMKELGLVLLTHTGEEKAVEAEENQRLGNPLLFRRPLDLGVRVLMSHCASLGVDEDLDNPGRDPVPSFRLFMRLMAEKRYEGLLFGEISAMTQFNRIGEPLTTLLDRWDLHARLVNGSDYPLPAINVIVRTGVLADEGYISDEEAEALSEIYDYNPLLFDFVVKRTLRSPRTGRRFPPEVFYGRPELSPD